MNQRNKKRQHYFYFLFFTILFFMVAACGSNTKPTTGVIPQIFVFPSGTDKRLISDEKILQDNCNGTAEMSQTVTRQHTVQYTMEMDTGLVVSADGKVGLPGVGEVGVGAEVAAHYKVSYGREETVSRSQTVAAAPGSHIQHAIQQFEIWETGEVLIVVGNQNQRFPYSFRRDFSIEAVAPVNVRDGCIIQPTSQTESEPTKIPTTPVLGFVDINTIVFAADREDSWKMNIYTMGVNGNNHVRLTNNSFEDWRPVWSPDGTRIAFHSTRDGNVEIYVMNSDGSNQTRLTSNSYDDLKPTWSPDGRQIAFSSNRDGNYEIYTMNADGSSQVRLTNNAYEDIDPSWSSDGRKLTFVSERDGNAEIYVMDANGLDQRRLTNNSSVDMDPAWSPSGTKIAFRSARDGNDEIYVMDANGNNQTRLTNNTSKDWRPAWSPDGTQIAFISNRENDDDFGLYIMDANGDGQIRIPNDFNTNHWDPSWRP